MTTQKLQGPFVVGFNGPPRAGKDTAMNLLCDRIDQSVWVNAPVIQRPLAQPMREMALKAIGLDYSFATYERLKDQVHPALGITLRQFMIRLSEDFMIPTFGPEIWCRLWYQSVPKGFAGIIVIPDIGFQREVDYLTRMYGKDHFAVMEVVRDGCTFDNDSRGFVNSHMKLHIPNNSTLQSLDQIVSVMLDVLSDMWAI